MENLFAYLIPIVAVGGGITYAILNRYWKSKERVGSPTMQNALAENTAVNKAMLEKLNSIDTRLSAVEKTLTDIQ